MSSLAARRNTESRLKLGFAKFWRGWEFRPWQVTATVTFSKQSGWTGKFAKNFSRTRRPSSGVRRSTSFWKIAWRRIRGLSPARLRRCRMPVYFVIATPASNIRIRRNSCAACIVTLNRRRRKITRVLRNCRGRAKLSRCVTNLRLCRARRSRWVRWNRNRRY